jgi:hypothetical protein
MNKLLTPELGTRRAHGQRTAGSRSYHDALLSWCGEGVLYMVASMDWLVRIIVDGFFIGVAAAMVLVLIL